MIIVIMSAIIEIISWTFYFLTSYGSEIYQMMSKNIIKPRMLNIYPVRLYESSYNELIIKNEYVIFLNI